MDVDSILVITYTERAAGELRGRIRKRLLELGRHDLVRDLDAAWISTIHGFCHRLLKAHPFAAGIDPRFRVRRRQPGPRAARRGLPRGARGVLRRGRGAAAAARLVRRPSAAADADRRARDAALVRARAADRSVRAAAARGAAARSCGSQRPATTAALRYLDSAQGPEELLDLSDLRSAELDEPRAAVEQAALEALAARDREQLQELLLGLRPSLPRGEGPRVGARLRGPAAARARAAARQPRDPRARELALPLDHGRRVPGHEPAPVRAGRPARARGRRGLLRRRRVPVDLPLPACGRRGLPRAARAGRRRARADAELPLAARGARRDQPPLRRRLRRLVPAARGGGPVPGSRRSGRRSSCS